MVIPWTRWRWCNFIIASLIFVFISHHVAVKTGQLTDWICNKKVSKSKTNHLRPVNGAPPVDYIPLPTIHNQPASSGAPSTADLENSEEKDEVERALLTPREDQDVLTRVWRWTSIAFDERLWFRMVVLVSGLWLINLIYPSRMPSIGRICQSFSYSDIKRTRLIIHSPTPQQYPLTERRTVRAKSDGSLTSIARSHRSADTKAHLSPQTRRIQSMGIGI